MLIIFREEQRSLGVPSGVIKYLEYLDEYSQVLSTHHIVLSSFMHMLSPSLSLEFWKSIME